MKKIVWLMILLMPTLAWATGDELVSKRASQAKTKLSEECKMDYRLVREDLYELRRCEKQSDCAPVFFTFPFGPEKCIFYGVAGENGEKRLKKAWETVDGFTQSCAKDQADYQAWLARQVGDFKMKPEDCTSGGMFATCDEGYCVTKFAYEIEDKFKKFSVK